jgi:hypothetical protein
MALPFVVEDLDAIPEQFRAEYSKQQDGKFRLGVDGLDDPEPLRKHIKELNTENAKRRGELKDLVAQFEGIDPVKARDIMARLEADEDLKLRSEGKHDEANKRLTQRMQEQHQKELDAERAKIKIEQDKTGKYRELVFERHLVDAASKAGCHPAAFEDIIGRARKSFTLDEDGNPVMLDTESGKAVMGKDGKGPLSPLEWLTDTMKEKAPIWFPVGASGGGATGDRGATPSSNQIRRDAFDRMSDVERMAFSKKGGKVID